MRPLAARPHISTKVVREAAAVKGHAAVSPSGPERQMSARGRAAVA